MSCRVWTDELSVSTDEPRVCGVKHDGERCGGSILEAFGEQDPTCGPVAKAARGKLAAMPNAGPLTEPYLPKWSLARVVRVAVYAILMAGAIETARTTPYLGLPFEPKPAFLDCYRQATWNGRTFVETGRVICLGGP
jgi:hypothetical protein